MSMKATLNYITPSGAEALRKEYQQLKDVERPEVVTTVSYAAALGDRSENADYIYGKKRLREIDRRLRFLQRRLEKAEVIDPTTIESDKVLFGATVTVEDFESGKNKTYSIVGEDEIDANRGHISWKSPIAKALLGKSEGDELTIHRPSGDLEVEIVKVAYVRIAQA